MSDYTKLKEDIESLRSEMKQGFQELKDWKSEAEVGMKGLPDRGVWGARQKIDHNRDKISDNLDKIIEVEAKVNKVIWMAIGGGSVAGTAAALIFSLFQSGITG